MTTYAQDRDGKYIPASQRPDGTWRKARRVKDGYVPQEEVPLYESKGKLFMKKPTIPVGMCPTIAQQGKERRDKQQQQQQQQQQRQNPIPGLFVLPQANNRTEPKKQQSNVKPTNGLSSTNKNNSASSTKKTKAVANNKTTAPATTATPPATSSSANDTKLVEQLKSLDISAGSSVGGDDDVAKRIKKFRKKLREIESIEAKIASGELKKPDADQMEKVARKNQILNHLKELERLEAE